MWLQHERENTIKTFPACCAIMGAALMMVACDRHKNDDVDARAPTSSGTATSSASTAPATAGFANHATVRSGGFDVRVSLSPVARKALARRAETIIVSASYYGWPVPGASIKVDDVGQIDLGREQHELDAPGHVHFAGATFPLTTEKVLEKPPEVNINVFSGRKSSPDNLLNCSIFQDAIAVATKSPVMISCKLLTEK